MLEFAPTRYECTSYAPSQKEIQGNWPFPCPGLGNSLSMQATTGCDAGCHNETQRTQNAAAHALGHYLAATAFRFLSRLPIVLYAWRWPLQWNADEALCCLVGCKSRNANEGRGIAPAVKPCLLWWLWPRSVFPLCTDSFRDFGRLQLYRVLCCPTYVQL